MMLNAAQADERYHVTADYILDESNNYTTEFWLFTVDYCRGEHERFVRQPREAVYGEQRENPTDH